MYQNDTPAMYQNDTYVKSCTKTIPLPMYQNNPSLKTENVHQNDSASSYEREGEGEFSSYLSPDLGNQRENEEVKFNFFLKAV